MPCRRCMGNPRGENDFRRAIADVAPPYRGAEPVYCAPITECPFEQFPVSCLEPAPDIDVCMDNSDECTRAIFEAEDRDQFWPSFAHPRSISCNDLYRR